MGQFIHLKAADGFSVPAYLALPAGTAKAAIVVIQEIFGVNSHIQAVTDRFAAQGYLAIAPAMFERVTPGVNLGYQPDDVTAGIELTNMTVSLYAQWHQRGSTVLRRRHHGTSRACPHSEVPSDGALWRQRPLHSDGWRTRLCRCPP